MDTLLEPGWKKILETEFAQPYFARLTQQVQASYTAGLVFPRQDHIFKALELCPFSKVHVVILGQDPYHGENQAHGLSFSVPKHEKIPPSLRNIYKEITADLGTLTHATGNLEAWATQGVLLLNATLTVEAHKAGSHQGLGWEQFTDAVIRKVSEEKQHVVFLLWGKYAEAKSTLIDETKHLVLKAPHPSPLSAHRGFLGCRHFSKTNEYLKLHGQSPIIW